MKYKPLILLGLIILGFVLFLLQGCATVEYCDTESYFKSSTLGKDIVVDPNGVMSTVSPKNQGIIEAVAGFIAGLAAAGL